VRRTGAAALAHSLPDIGRSCLIAGVFTGIAYSNRGGGARPPLVSAVEFVVSISARAFFGFDSGKQANSPATL